MGPKYRYHYFNLTALGEPARYILAYGNVDYEDCRYAHGNNTGADWAQQKPKMPFGKMPVLEVDGKMIYQSGAICRYLAKQTGLAGKDDLENLQIDSICDTFVDFRQQIAGWIYDPHAESKKSKWDPLTKETMPFYLGRFEEMVKNNGGFFVNGKMTWADIYFVAPMKYYNTLLEFDCLEKYPNLCALRQKVESNPQIATYIAKRPTTDK